MLRPAAAPIRPVAAIKRKGTLYIVAQAHTSSGAPGSFAIRYQHGDLVNAASRTRRIASALELLDFLEALGVELSTPSVKAGLAELYASGSASISGVWLTDYEASQHGLI